VQNEFIRDMNNQKIFRIIFIVFTAIMVCCGIYFMVKTTPPWEKRAETIEKYKVK